MVGAGVPSMVVRFPENNRVFPELTDMAKPSTKRVPVPLQLVERRIHSVREHQVMLDTDLADLYQVPTKAFKQAVRRNIARFPQDFMIQLTLAEAAALKSQIEAADGDSLRSQSVTLKRGHHAKYRPYAFTEQGVAMLSSVLKSPRAVRVNIAIMRAFVQLRQLATRHKDLLLKVNDMEAKYDGQFRDVFSAIRRLMEPPAMPKRRIGFPAATRV